MPRSPSYIDDEERARLAYEARKLASQQAAAGQPAPGSADYDPGYEDKNAGWHGPPDVAYGTPGDDRAALSSAWEQEKQQLAAFQEMERERLVAQSGQQAQYGAQQVAGAAAGGSAASLRGGAYGRGQIGADASSQLAVDKAQLEAYFRSLEQELLARGATYEQAAQAVADARSSQKRKEQADQAPAAAAARAGKSESDDAAVQEWAAGGASAIGGAG
jgi:hypothetical protein